MRHGAVRRIGRTSVRRRIVGLLVAGATVVAPGAAFADNGLAFLKIGVGARAVALGNAVVSQVDDASASYWNPGALPLLEGSRAELMHNESFGGVRYEFASLTRDFGRHGAGVSFSGVWTDPIRGYDAAGSYQGEFGYYDLALSGSYGFSPFERVGIGVGVEYLRESIDTSVADGNAFSFGLQVREILPRTDLGAAVLHAGSSMKFESAEFELPTTVQGGLTHRVPLDAMNSSLLVAAEVRQIRGEDAQVLLGTEYGYREAARLQVGYRSGLDAESMSLGLGVGQGKVRGQYAFVPFQDNLGDQHRISLLMNW